MDPTDEQLSVQLECGRRSDAMLVSFAGHSGPSDSAPPFELRDIARRLPAKAVFLRDPERSWYHRGLPRFARGIEDVGRFVKNLRERESVERVIAVGNSAGGYAAILFGVLGEVDEVHAFGPQTRLIDASDTRHPERLSVLQPRNELEHTALDLRQLLVDHPSRRARIHVYYSRFNSMDHRHARRLAGLPRVDLFEYPALGHGLVRTLKDNGLLEAILQAAVSGQSIDAERLSPKGSAAFWAIIGSTLGILERRLWRR